MVIKIFGSYTSADSPLVQLICERLEINSTIKFYLFERDANFLMPINDEIKMAIDEADYFMLFWSRNTEDRGWVTGEFDYALEREAQQREAGRKTNFIIIIRLDDTDLPIDLRRHRHLNYKPEVLNRLRAFLEKGAGNTGPLINTPSPLRSTAQDIMSPNIIFCYPDDTLEHAYFIMDSRGIRHLLVLDRKDETVQGFLSKRDILKRMVPPVDSNITIPPEEADKMGKIPVKDIMTPRRSLIRAKQNTPLLEVLEKLVRKPIIDGVFRRISAVPVIEDHKAFGIISYIDIFKYIEGNGLIPSNLTAESLVPANQQLINVLPQDTLETCRFKMDSAGVRHIFVIDDNQHFVGMVDDLTVLHLMNDQIDLEIGEMKVKNFMQQAENLRWIRNTTLLDEIVQIFLQSRNITALPVVDLESKTAIGIVSYVDVLNAFYNHWSSQ
ncbi:MAG: CBS domain-containing protein [Chloroflexi bacterium]|nr:MAG: CBS domain-containing protein [Chloroflexota bacterium]